MGWAGATLADPSLGLAQRVAGQRLPLALDYTLILAGVTSFLVTITKTAKTVRGSWWASVRGGVGLGVWVSYD